MIATILISGVLAIIADVVVRLSAARTPDLGSGRIYEIYRHGHWLYVDFWHHAVYEASSWGLIAVIAISALYMAGKYLWITGWPNKYSR